MERETVSSRRHASLAPAPRFDEICEGTEPATTTTTPFIPDWMRRRGDGQGTADRTATPEEFARVLAKAEDIWGRGRVVPAKLKHLCKEAGHLSWVDAALDECRDRLEGGNVVKWNMLQSVLTRFKREGGPDPPPAVPEPFISDETTWIDPRDIAAAERRARNEAEDRRRRETRAAWDALKKRERNRRIEAARKAHTWARDSDRLAEAIAYLEFAEALPPTPEVTSGETQ